MAGGVITAYNDALNRASQRYRKKSQKRIAFDVKKDYYDTVILPAAQKRNLPVRRFLIQAIEEKIARDKETESGNPENTESQDK